MEQQHRSYIEQNVAIPIPETMLEIHGVLRGEYSQPVAILAPGLGGWAHDLLMFNASRYFEGEGVATLRVSFYGDNRSQRNIGDFDVKTNAADIDTVVDYVKNQSNTWVCVVGHSYSGMATVYSQKQQFDAAVLWDPSHTSAYSTQQAQSNLVNDFVYVDSLGSYVSASGPGYVLSRRVFENYAPGSAAMAASFRVSTLVVNAQNSGEAMQRYGQDYASAIDAKTKHVVIEGASHPFTEDGALERLYSVTVDWIKNKLNNL